VQSLRGLAAKHKILMTEPDDFGMQRRLGSKEIADREKDVGDQKQHGGWGAAVKAEMSDGGTYASLMAESCCVRNVATSM
jgi:hypothetical protein